MVITSKSQETFKSVVSKFSDSPIIFFTKPIVTISEDVEVVTIRTSNLSDEYFADDTEFSRCFSSLVMYLSFVMFFSLSFN
jgi:hypothetical protein